MSFKIKHTLDQRSSLKDITNTVVVELVSTGKTSIFQGPTGSTGSNGSITAGTNLVASPSNPITTSGTLSLSPTLTSMTSIDSTTFTIKVNGLSRWVFGAGGDLQNDFTNGGGIRLNNNQPLTLTEANPGLNQIVLRAPTFVFDTYSITLPSNKPIVGNDFQFLRVKQAGTTTFEPFLPLRQIVYVETWGSDFNDGSFDRPFQTLVHALSTITTASSSNLFVIQLGVGVFNEGQIILKPFIYINGQSTRGATTLGSSNDIIFNTLISDTNPKSAGLSNITIAGTGNMNLNCVTAGWNLSNSFFINNVYNGNDVSVTGVSSDNFVISNTSFSNFTSTNCFSFMTDNITNGNVTINATGSDAGAVLIKVFVGGNLTFLSSGSNNLTGFFVTSHTTGSSFTVDGTNSTVYSDAGAYPTKGQLILLNGASAPLHFSDATSLAYTPTTLSNWSGVQPTSVQNALDRIASKIFPIP